MNTGRIILDLPPTEDNNRNSEGAFIQLRDGKLLFAWSRYGAGGRSDWAAADIYGMISADEGESFSQPFPILTHQQNDAGSRGRRAIIAPAAISRGERCHSSHWKGRSIST